MNFFAAQTKIHQFVRFGKSIFRTFFFTTRPRLKFNINFYASAVEQHPHIYIHKHLPTYIHTYNHHENVVQFEYVQNKNGSDETTARISSRTTRTNAHKISTASISEIKTTRKITQYTYDWLPTYSILESSQRGDRKKRTHLTVNTVVQ